jgi:glycine/D-amino acid oxidase-like deaminating enzyme
LGVRVPLEIERQTMHWFEPSGAREHVSPSRFPVALIEHEQHRVFYVMPDLGDGVKAAIHHEGAKVSPITVDRTVSVADTEPVRHLVERYVPGARGAIRESVVCLYTDTPDEHFILDVLPQRPGIVLGSACSGHGFKFASALGEIAAQMLLEESLSGDVSLFSLGRFATGETTKQRN